MAAFSFVRMQEECLFEDGRKSTRKYSDIAHEKSARLDVSYQEEAPKLITEDELKACTTAGLCWHGDVKWQ